MQKRKGLKRRNYGQEVTFEVELRRAPAAARTAYLAWLRPWRKRPERVFWVVKETGGRKQV
jgi:hypothetical protein